jgi:hypothetical protein
MADRFRVEPDEVVSVAQAFTQQQDVPTRLAGQLDGARGADAGDPGLNGEIQALVGDLVAALTGLTAGLTQDAGGLNMMAENYRSVDSTILGGFDKIRSGLQP